MRPFVLAAALALFVACATDASAQGFIAPFVGTTVTSPTVTSGSSKAGFGIAFGGLGKIVGALGGTPTTAASTTTSSSSSSSGGGETQQLLNYLLAP